MSTKNYEGGNNDFLKTFGFVSNQARKNLVIFFIVLLIFSNAFFIYRNIKAEDKIEKLNAEKLQISLDLSAKITEEVRKQVLPATTKILDVAQKVDSVTTKANLYLNNKKN